MAFLTNFQQEEYRYICMSDAVTLRNLRVDRGGRRENSSFFY